MSAPVVKGWCPGAYTPMASGDGLIVRVRPHMGRVSNVQMMGLCDLASRYAKGTVDLTNRANLQLRGLHEDQYQTVLDALLSLGLLDADPATEARRNMLVTPFWQPGELSEQLGQALIARLDELPDLPAKFGFAVDCGEAPVLRQSSADIRLERAGASKVLVLADGASLGRVAGAETAIDHLVELAHWFAKVRTPENRRMAQVIDHLPADWCRASPLPADDDPMLDAHHHGELLGAPFGSFPAGALADLLRQTDVGDIALTPWRMMRLIGTKGRGKSGFITDPSDPSLRASACPGAPDCGSASVETRTLALKLADRFGGELHVSGCSKGCAHPRRAGTTLVGREGRFDLVADGCSWDEPHRRGLTPSDVLSEVEQL